MERRTEIKLMMTALTEYWQQNSKLTFGELIENISKETNTKINDLKTKTVLNYCISQITNEE